MAVPGFPQFHGFHKRKKNCYYYYSTFILTATVTPVRTRKNEEEFAIVNAMKGVFITGTDTNVGKTVVSAAVFHRYRATMPLCYWKPIQTGIETDDDTATVRALGECCDSEIFDRGVRLSRPVSPHLAARLAGTTIRLDAVAGLISASSGKVNWIVEGAGGVLAPINDSQLMIDLIEMLRLPALVVARSSLGTINHTLLSLEALRRRSLPIAGVVMVGEPNSENRDAIERYGDVRVIAETPMLDGLTHSSLAFWARDEFDKNGLLMEHLGG